MRGGRRPPLTHSEGVWSRHSLDLAAGPASAPNFCASIMFPLTFILPAMKAWFGVWG